MVILYASSHGSGLRSISHTFPVNDHNHIYQNWDYISFLLFIQIGEMLQICNTANTIDLKY